jgi:Mn-containing catalase
MGATSLPNAGMHAASASQGGEPTRLATVKLGKADVKITQAMATRTASDTSKDPTTGADLGSGQSSEQAGRK